MPALTPRLLARRAMVAVNLRRPDKPVRRVIRDVEMVMPRRHMLHYLAAPSSPYGLNLIRLAEELASRDGTLTLLDVGANIGDSAPIVLDKVPGRAVCVEPDPAWLKYLHLNTDHREDIAVEGSALLPPGMSTGFTVVHHDLGSSRLAPSEEGAGPPAISTDDLLVRHPDLADVRLIKTDTDGYDVLLVPALARTFASSRPVIFLEFELIATGLATPDLTPESVWEQLIELGYEDAVLWTNVGELIGPARVDSLIKRTGELRREVDRGSTVFWDVAVAHRDDKAGLQVLEAVCAMEGFAG
jgi:FkbM family methyltransferase